MTDLRLYVDENLHQLEVLLRQWQGANGDRRLIISKRVHKLVQQIKLIETFVIKGGNLLFVNDELIVGVSSEKEQSLTLKLQKTCQALVREDEKNKPQLSLSFYQLLFKMLKNSQLYPSLLH